MKFIFSILAFTAVLFASPKTDCSKMELGNIVQIQKSESALIISSSEILPSSEFMCKDILFKYAVRWVDKKNHAKGMIVYISTTDTTFSVGEGIHPGDTLVVSEIEKKTKTSISSEKGWGSFLPLKDGWNLGFEMEGGEKANLPEGKKVVRWIFKRATY